MNRPSRDGSSDQSLDGYGPNRLVGRIYSEFPGVFIYPPADESDLSEEYANLATRFVRLQSISHFKKALKDKSFPVALNTVYYAEALSKGSAADRKLASQILDELLAQDPETFNPARIPETKAELELAKKLRAKLH